MFDHTFALDLVACLVTFSPSVVTLIWLSLSEALRSNEVTEFDLDGSFDVGQLESPRSKRPLDSEAVLSLDLSLGGLLFPSLIKDLTLFIVTLLYREKKFHLVLINITPKDETLLAIFHADSTFFFLHCKSKGISDLAQQQLFSSQCNCTNFILISHFFYKKQNEKLIFNFGREFKL